MSNLIYVELFKAEESPLIGGLGSTKNDNPEYWNYNYLCIHSHLSFELSSAVNQKIIRLQFFQPNRHSYVHVTNSKNIPEFHRMYIEDILDTMTVKLESATRDCIIYVVPRKEDVSVICSKLNTLWLNIYWNEKTD